MGKRFTKNCDHCGSEHSVVPSDIRHGKGKYCSKECRYSANGLKYRNGKVLVCPVCSSNFYVAKNRIKRTEELTCSKDCSSKIKMKGKYLGCIQCGKTFYVFEARAKDINRANKFCSHKCQGKYYTGEAHYQYKGGTINESGYRRIPVNGKTPYEHRHIAEQHLGRKLRENEDVHHINRQKLDNRIENLIVMTKSWHTKIHHILRTH